MQRLGEDLGGRGDEARADLFEARQACVREGLAGDEARAEIARLRAPPEADVMERAWKALDRTPPPKLNLYRQDWQRAEDVARALTEYGDQRAREAPP